MSYVPAFYFGRGYPHGLAVFLERVLQVLKLLGVQSFVGQSSLDFVIS
jgi:hypothetical protein